ncbi:uncharacterized protein LOC143909816 [Arctopsyche grandis]|uniref:uncharacterized protein LOC143909816 n=1 Tax=Arctopsyche grandis TaxID=121162 RepID=UPI00406D7F67
MWLDYRSDKHLYRFSKATDVSDEQTLLLLVGLLLAALKAAKDEEFSWTSKPTSWSPTLLVAHINEREVDIRAINLFFFTLSKKLVNFTFVYNRKRRSRYL